MHKVGIYSGTFDPVTNGHLDVIERGYELFDYLYVTVAENINKKIHQEDITIVNSMSQVLEYIISKN